MKLPYRIIDLTQCAIKCH